MRIGNRHFLLLSSGSLPYYFVSLRLVIGTCHLPLSSTFVRKGTIINNMINYTNLILQVLLLFVFIIFNYKMAADGDIVNVRCRISFYFVFFFFISWNWTAFLSYLRRHTRHTRLRNSSEFSSWWIETTFSLEATARTVDGRRATRISKFFILF